MKILLLEDEVLASEKLQKILKEIDSKIEITAVLTSVDQAIHWLKTEEHPDLIISDIHLNDGICFNIFSEINIECPIIFATAYEKYAIKAFEVNSIDYLLKPIQKDRLQQALDKYNKINHAISENKSDLFNEFKSLLANQNRDYKARFLCKLGNKIKSVPIEKIKYFYSKDKMTFIIDEQNNKLPINNTLDEIDQMIDPNEFFRVNRQYITHFNAIDEIHPYFKGRLKLKLKPKNVDDIVVSTEKSPQFKSWLNR